MSFRVKKIRFVTAVDLSKWYINRSNTRYGSLRAHRVISELPSNIRALESSLLSFVSAVLPVPGLRIRMKYEKKSGSENDP